MRRKHRQLGAASCSRDSRLLRGTVGFFVGSLVGSLVGVAIALPFVAGTEEKVGRPRIVGITSTLSLIGCGVGIYIGARRPEC